MRISKQILSFLLVAVLPTTSALPGGSDAYAGKDASADSAQGSEVSQTASWGSILSHSHYIFEGIQNAYLPSALRISDAVQSFMQPKPPPPDFWDEAKEYGQKLQDYVHTLLKAAETYFKSTKFTGITTAMNHIVDATATFRDNIKGALDAHNVTLDAFTEELESIFTGIVKDLEKIPPPNKAAGHAERTAVVDKVLDDTEQSLTALAMRYGIKEEIVATYLHAIRPHVEALTVAVGDINEQYPELLPTLIFSVATLLIPESWILRPFLSVFGFGPAGPVKGSAAAWMQRYFWGGAVKAGSWFSLLQAAGMGVLPKWAALVTKAPLLIGGALAFILPRFCRR